MRGGGSTGRCRWFDLFRCRGGLSDTGFRPRETLAAVVIPTRAGRRGRNRVVLPLRGETSYRILLAHAIALGKARRAADAFSDALGFPSVDGAHLPVRIRFAMDAG